MGDINTLLQKAEAIAFDNIPAGGSGGEGQKLIVQIFKNNPGKYFTGKVLKQLFKEEDIEIKAVSNILHKLYKDGVLERPKTGAYKLAGS